jgi:phage gp36-like protein
MPYASQDGLIARFGAAALIDLTDRAIPPEGEIDEGVVTAALEDTDALIDGYLAKRYRLPITGQHRLLAALAETIAFYKLHAHVVGEKVAQDYRDALRTLERIAAGDVRLTGLEGAEPAGSGAAGVRTTDRERPLTPENMKGFI